jgi:hypothetical protein
VEELIFNLCEGVETRATETKIEAYRRENAADIARRQQRNAEEDRRLGELAGTSGAGDGETAPKDPGADPWAPRRMSADVSDLDETPGPGAGGNARERKSDGFETNPRGFGGLFGYTPGSQTGAQAAGCSGAGDGGARADERRKTHGGGATGGTHTTPGGTTPRATRRRARSGKRTSRKRVGWTC